MKTTRILLLSVICLLVSCKKNDDSTPMGIALQNEPPLSFSLIDVPHNAKEVDITTTLTWESAKNPKGDEVTYDLYIEEILNPSTLIKNNISGTSFKTIDRLHLLTNYYWRVVAKDTEGQTSQSAIHKFTTRNLNFPKEPVADATNFPLLSNHTSVVYNNKLWVIGSYGNDDNNQVWSSENGSAWTLINESTPFSPRTGFTAVVFDNKLWVIGGYEEEDINDGPMGKIDTHKQLKKGFKSSPGYKNDVWYTTDGMNWEAATLSAEFSKRLAHSTVVFDNKIWLIGGGGDEGSIEDIWYSENGTNWNLATEELPFSGFIQNGVVVFNDKLWAMGVLSSETNKNEIWSSNDGSNWERVIPIAAFSNRNSYAITEFDNKLWVLGGYNADGDSSTFEYNRDIWYSNDGISWKEAYTSVPFLDRYRHNSLVFDEKLWVIGGVALEGSKQDVWALD